MSSVTLSLVAKITKEQMDSAQITMTVSFSF